MAKIHEEIIVIKLSKLVKDGIEIPGITGSDTLEALEQVVQELVGNGVIVEAQIA